MTQSFLWSQRVKQRFCCFENISEIFLVLFNINAQCVWVSWGDPKLSFLWVKSLDMPHKQAFPTSLNIPARSIHWGMTLLFSFFKLTLVRKKHQISPVTELKINLKFLEEMLGSGRGCSEPSRDLLFWCNEIFIHRTDNNFQIRKFTVQKKRVELFLNKQVVKYAVTSYGKQTRLISVFFKTLHLDRNVDLNFWMETC